MLRLAFPGGLAALLLLTAGTSPARAEGADKDVKAIIAKAIEARGGAAAIAKYKASTSTFKGTFRGMGDAIAMKGTSKEQAPDKLRLEIEMSAMGMDVSIVQVLNGDKGWFGFNGNFDDMPKEVLDESREQIHVRQVSDLRNLTDKDVQLKSLGESKLGDATAVGVRVSAKGFRDVDLYFDKDKGLLLQTETKGVDVQGGGGAFMAKTLYRDYKKADGVMRSFKQIVLHDDKPFFEMEMTKITPAEKLDDKDFAKP